jgi:hypothetical protein
MLAAVQVRWPAFRSSVTTSTIFDDFNLALSTSKGVTDVGKEATSIPIDDEEHTLHARSSTPTPPTMIARQAIIRSP